MFVANLRWFETQRIRVIKNKDFNEFVANLRGFETALLPLPPWGIGLFVANLRGFETIHS